MSDTPKFTVVDRRKFRAEDDSAVSKPAPESAAAVSADAGTISPASSAPASGPARLTLVEPPQARVEAESSPVAVADAPETEEGLFGEPDLDSEVGDAALPPAPSIEESRFQKASYDKAAERLDNLVRAQNPGAPAPEKIGFEHLVQQLYLSAMMQMGAGTPEGQRPRIDILGARQTIDLLGVVLEKSKGNLSAHEERTLQTVLYELRMTFLELTRMISAQPGMPPPPGAGKR